MSSSFTEKQGTSKSYIKLEIFQSQICQNIKLSLPYGLSISFENFPEKYIEPIKNENEFLKSLENQFIYYLNNNNLTQDDLIGKEFIINSYSTSIFMVKKNFASVKIPILYSKKNNEKKWFFLKDLKDNICIKILVSIEISLLQKTKEYYYINCPNNILKENSETIKENKMDIYNKSSNNSNEINHKKNNSNKYLINNFNTYLGSTNFNSISGNSFINITNNVFMKTINNTSNLNLNDMNITFPFNFSPIPVCGKNNSFFIGTKRETIKNENINSYISNDLFNKKYFKNKDNNINIKKNKIEDLKLITENECDSLTINNNDIGSEELSNNEILSNNKIQEKNDNLFEKINDLITMKNEEILDYQLVCSNNYNNYLKAKGNTAKNIKIIDKENEKFKNKIKNIEKSKQIYEARALNLNENMISYTKNLNRKKIQNELDDYERLIMINLNNINLGLNNIENELTHKNNINDYINNNKRKSIIIENKEKPPQKNTTKKSKLYSFEVNSKIELTSLNRTIFTPKYIKKLSFPNQLNAKISNKINSNRKSQKFNKKYSPINYKLKEFNTKLNLSISNSDHINEENNYNNNIINNAIKSYINKNIINNNKYKNHIQKKYSNIFKDYKSDTFGRKEYKKKPSKSNLIRGNIKLKIENSNINPEASLNYQYKHALSNNNWNEEALAARIKSKKTYSNNKISNKTININSIIKIKKKLCNTNCNKIKSNKYLFISKYLNNNYKNSNTSLDENLFSIENKYSYNTINTQPSLDKNNTSKRKINKDELNYKQKSFNNERLKNLYSYNKNYFRGKPILISNHSNYIGDNYSFKINHFNTDYNLSKRTIDACPKANKTINSTRIIRRKMKTNTVKSKLKININSNESNKKKNTKFRNSLIIPGDIFLSNSQKQNKRNGREKYRINSKNFITLTHTYSKLIGININNKNNKNDLYYINGKNIGKQKMTKDKGEYKSGILKSSKKKTIS